MRSLPTVTGSGEVLWVTERSASLSTVVFTVLALLAGSGSLSLLVTLTVLLIVVLLVEPGLMTIVTVALVLAAKLFISQFRNPPDLLQVPWLGRAERKLTPAGRVSVKIIPVAWEGPLLVTVIV